MKTKDGREEKYWVTDRRWSGRKIQRILISRPFYCFLEPFCYFNRSIAICRRSHPVNNAHVFDQVVKIFTVKLNSFCAIEFSARAICNRTDRHEKKANWMSSKSTTKTAVNAFEHALNLFLTVEKGWSCNETLSSTESHLENK
jgi:hypothetical protein